MKAIGYHIRRILWNTVKATLRKPAVLVVYLLLAALIVAAAFMGGANEVVAVQNVDVYSAAVMGLFAFILVISIMQGMKQGAAIFRMSDVNLLFTSPVQPRTILIYGIAKQFAILAFASLFMLAQYGNIRRMFGLGTEAMLGLIAGYILIGLFAQLLSANLYAFCASSETRRGRVEWFFRAVLIAVIAFFAVYALGERDLAGAARGFFGSAVWNFIPVIGWSKALAYYSAYGNLGMSLLFAFLLLASCGAMILWLQKSNQDYYEDVLQSAESTQARLEAAREGRVTASGTVSKKVKRDLGNLKGRGAWAFYYRIQRENQRRNKFVFTISSIIAAAAPLAAKLIFSDMHEGGLWGVLYFSAYMLIFTSLTSPVNKELTQPYLYLAPVPAFRKLAAILAPQMIGYLVDGLVFAVMCAAVLGASVFTAAFAALAYVGINVVYAVGLLLVQRLLGGLKNKVLIIFLFFIILILLVMPGFIVSMLVASTPAAYLICFACHMLIAAGALLMSRSVLNAMEA